ncbi:protein kinase 4-like [Acanthaster planci]|uniref:Protein kinase 4-like n=1 Tax=Acanthaster planci TaxID=133434 RepID=A0A8B7Y9F5_ACAPL|nr:protein kinase 4-like [Acanthaster planci]
MFVLGRFSGKIINRWPASLLGKKGVLSSNTQWQQCDMFATFSPSLLPARDGGLPGSCPQITRKHHWDYGLCGDNEAQVRDQLWSTAAEIVDSAVFSSSSARSLYGWTRSMILAGENNSSNSNINISIGTSNNVNGSNNSNSSNIDSSTNISNNCSNINSSNNRNSSISTSNNSRNNSNISSSTSTSNNSRNNSNINSSTSNNCSNINSRNNSKKRQHQQQHKHQQQHSHYQQQQYSQLQQQRPQHQR